MSKYVTPGVLWSPSVIAVDRLCAKIDKMVDKAFMSENTSFPADNYDGELEENLDILRKTIANLQMKLRSVEIAYEALPSCETAGTALQMQLHQFMDDYKDDPFTLYEQLHMLNTCPGIQTVQDFVH